MGTITIVGAVMVVKVTSAAHDAAGVVVLFVLGARQLTVMPSSSLIVRCSVWFGARFVQLFGKVKFNDESTSLRPMASRVNTFGATRTEPLGLSGLVVAGSGLVVSMRAVSSARMMTSLDGTSKKALTAVGLLRTNLTLPSKS